ncbi:MAG: DUF4123 domain-containing protein [Cryomorphaceae bacterium]
MSEANYIVLDAARMSGQLNDARELNPEHICLYEGDSERFLGTVAPWLFDFEEDSEFAGWLGQNSDADSWGIFLKSSADPNEVYRHLRKFLIVTTEDGRELYFRFYDPRVLRVFLPTCDKEQLVEFFGPVECFIAEDENGLLVEYTLSGGALQPNSSGKEFRGYFPEAPVVRADQIAEVNSNPAAEAGSKSVNSSTGPGQFENDKQDNESDSSASKNKSDGWDFGY